MRSLVIVNHLTADQTALWETASCSSNWDVHLAGPPIDPSLEIYAAKSELPNGLINHQLSPYKMRANAGHTWWVFPELKTLIDYVRPDIVHVNSEIWGALVTQALFHHPRVIAHGADNQFVFGAAPVRYIRSKMLRRNIRMLAGYASWNTDGATLAKTLRPGLPTTVVPAIAIRDPAVCRSVNGRANGKLRLGIIGRLSPQKGVGTVLEAIEKLDGTTKANISLHAVGDGPMAPALESLGEVEVTLHGVLDQSETLAVIADMDAVLAMSTDTRTWREQYCRVAVEAMAAGVPVIASDSGALPEVVGEDLVIRQGDSGALAIRISRLIDDQEYRRSCSVAARRRYLRKHTPEVGSMQLVRLWDEIV